MRTRTSLVAAAMAAVVATAGVIPANAQSATNVEGSNSSFNSETNTSSANCIAVGLAAGLPLLLLVPIGIGATVKIPGIENLNAQIQAQLGVFDKDLARQFDQFKTQIGAAAGVTGAALGVAAAVYLAKNCTGDDATGSSTGSSATGNDTDGSSNLEDFSIDGSSTPDADNGSSDQNQDGSSTQDQDGSSDQNQDNSSSVDRDSSSLSGSSVNTGYTANATVGTPAMFPLNTLVRLAANAEVISVDGLPAGLTYNAEDKLIEGVPTTAGESTVTVTVKSLGVESKLSFKINVAD